MCLRRRSPVSSFRFVAFEGNEMSEGIVVSFRHISGDFFMHRYRDIISIPTSVPYLSIELIDYRNIGKGGHSQWTILPGNSSRILFCYRGVLNKMALDTIEKPAPIKVTITSWETSEDIWPDRDIFTALLTSERMDELMMLRLTYG